MKIAELILQILCFLMLSYLVYSQNSRTSIKEKLKLRKRQKEESQNYEELLRIASLIESYDGKIRGDIK